MIEAKRRAQSNKQGGGAKETRHLAIPLAPAGHATGHVSRWENLRVEVVAKHEATRLGRHSMRLAAAVAAA
jgi:hypothetical protein